MLCFFILQLFTSLWLLLLSLNDIEGQAQGHITVAFMYLFIFLCPRCLFPFRPSPNHCCLELFANCRKRVVVFVYLLLDFFLSRVVEGCSTPSDIQKGSPGVSFWSRARRRGRRHRPLLSPQRWATLSRGPLTDL